MINPLQIAIDGLLDKKNSLSIAVNGYISNIPNIIPRNGGGAYLYNQLKRGIPHINLEYDRRVGIFKGRPFCSWLEKLHCMLMLQDGTLRESHSERSI
jgi:hypothetical protein